MVDADQPLRQREPRNLEVAVDEHVVALRRHGFEGDAHGLEARLQNVDAIDLVVGHFGHGHGDGIVGRIVGAIVAVQIVARHRLQIAQMADRFVACHRLEPELLRGEQQDCSGYGRLADRGFTRDRTGGGGKVAYAGIGLLARPKLL